MLWLLLLAAIAQADFSTEYMYARQHYKQDITLAQVQDSIMAKLADGRMSADYPPKCIQNFTILNNKRSNLEQWQVGGESAAMSRTHIFLVPHFIIDWRYYNIISLPASQETLKMLDDMEYYALEYAHSIGVFNASLFFHCHPHFSIPYLHLHVIDTDYLGPSYELYKHINMPLEVVRSVIKQEMQYKPEPVN